MSTELKTNYPFSLEEYFAVIKVEGAPLEYWDYQMVIMGGSAVHSILCSNAASTLIRASPEEKPRDCSVYCSQATQSPGLKPFRLPDCAVVQGETEWTTIEHDIGVVMNPTLIVEVLSPVSEEVDRGRKFESYKLIESFREYLLISHEEFHVTHWIKEPYGAWISQEITDLDSRIHLEAFDFDYTIEMRDLYHEWDHYTIVDSAPEF